MTCGKNNSVLVFEGGDHFLLGVGIGNTDDTDARVKDTVGGSARDDRELEGGVAGECAEDVGS